MHQLVPQTIRLRMVRVGEVDARLLAKGEARRIGPEVEVELTVRLDEGGEGGEDGGPVLGGFA